MTAFDKQVIQLYTSGLSAIQIANVKNISRDVVYNILKKNDVKRRNRSEQYALSPKTFYYKSKLNNFEKTLETAALMLYMGEGAKTGTRVDFVNSDPVMIKIFLKYLRQICRANDSKFRFYLYCFSDQNIEQIIEYWSNELEVDKKNFTKPYVQQRLCYSNRIMPWGVLHIRYNDKRLLEKILDSCSSLADKILD